MKIRTLLITLGALVLQAVVANAQVYSSNIVGYANIPMQVGDNWIGNPLDAPPNLLSALIPTAPNNTTVSLWNSTLNAFTPTVTFSGGAWSSDLTLNPGTGVRLHTSTAFTNIFVGNVLDFTGASWGGGDLHMPSPFGGAPGLYLLSSKAPALLSGHVWGPTGPFSLWESIVGRAPRDGEQVTTLDPVTQLYSTTTFIGGAWNNGDPTLAVGEAAMLNIGPVPEPSALALLTAGLVAMAAARRRQHRGA